jgi:2-hydroxychromene-2-carboxylate isomerase
MAGLEFWFDYSCPYAYVASTGAAAFAARLGVPLSWHPMLLGGVFAARGTPQNLAGSLPAPKATHLLRDQARMAARARVPLRHPPEHPRRTVDALRATLARGCDPQVIAAFYRAYWAEGRAVEDRAVVREIAGDVDLDAQRAALRAVTDEAIELGIFGAPTWVWRRDDGTATTWFGGDRATAVERQVRMELGFGSGSEDSLPALAPAGSTCDFWFDYSSPYAFLGACQVPRLEARTGTRVRWRPMLLGAVFRAVDQVNVPLFSYSEARQSWTLRDLDEQAALAGTLFRVSPHFPLRTILPARLTLAHPDPVPFAQRIFRATWIDGLDTTDLAVLRELGAGDVTGEENASDDAILDVANRQKQALHQNTDEAVAAGIFGAPGFVVRRAGAGPWLFWGQDRLDHVEAALTGWDPPA